MLLVLLALASALPLTEDRPSALRMSTEGEVSIGSDGSVWLGPSTGLCVAFRWICGGLALRYARRSGDQTLDGNHFEVLARAQAGLRFWRITVDAHLGAGPSSTSVSSGRFLGPCSRFTCLDTRLTHAGLAIAGGLAATYHATRWIGVVLAATASATPLFSAETSPEISLWFMRISIGLKVEV